MKYNPQLKIELFQLVDGKEEPMTTEVIPADLCHHQGNKPVKCQVSISKSLGSIQDSCNITLHNPPILERIRTAPAAYLSEIRGQVWRVKVWAWWSNTGAKTEPPGEPPKP